MPLAPIQKEVAALLAPNRSEASHLEGAGALHLDAGSLRMSEDLDFFHDDLAAVAKAFEADRTTLEKSGYAWTCN